MMVTMKIVFKILVFIKNVFLFTFFAIGWLSMGCYLDTQVSHRAFNMFLIGTIALPFILDLLFIGNGKD